MDESLLSRLQERISNAGELRELEGLRTEILGKRGELHRELEGLVKLPMEERRSRGKLLNSYKVVLERQLESRLEELGEEEVLRKMEGERLDMSLDSRQLETGSVHLLTRVREEIVDIFTRLGFGVAEGPDIEDDFHNFGALNFKDEHPARLDMDTFYIARSEDENEEESREEESREGGERLLLRTHTSPVQIRSMLSSGAPLRIISPGRTYRCDSDQTHTPMFHQVEGLYVDRGIHLGHLKSVLSTFCEEFFAITDLPIRFRPSYFPFTEPSMEVDIGCSHIDGRLRIGRGEDWLEILGSGMVHPRVLENCHIDTEKYQGFAFGMGLERLAMLKYGINDLRTFFHNDSKWLRTYGMKVTELD